jgi:hypothetical protein
MKLGLGERFRATIPDNADMAKLGGSKTEANLKAFAGKAQANRRMDIADYAGNSAQVL